MANKIKQLAPAHFKFFEWSYRHEASLFCVNKERDIVRLTSSSGVRQGDVLAPLWYCIATRYILDQLEQDFPLIEVYAYIDNIDILILAPPASNDGELNVDHRTLPYQQPDKFVAHTVKKILQTVTESAATIGARLQPAKCVLFAPQQRMLRDCHDLGVQLSHQGTHILGVPVGQDDFVDTQVRQQLAASSTRAVKALLDIDLPAQDKMLLLRHCIATIPVHVVRTVALNTSTTTPNFVFNDWDQAMCRALKAILHLEDIDETLVDLPVRLGGFGIRCMTNLCSMAFSASLMQANAVLVAQTGQAVACTANTMQRIWPYLQEILNLFPPPEEAGRDGQMMTATVQQQIDNKIVPTCGLPPRRGEGIQQALTFHRDDQRAQIFMESLPDRVAPLFADSRACSAWLNIHPSNRIFEMEDSEFLTLARARALHDPVAARDTCFWCRLVNPPANHHYTCRGFGDWRLQRHNYITRLVRAACPADTLYQAVLSMTTVAQLRAPGPPVPASRFALPHMIPMSTSDCLIADLLMFRGIKAIAVDITVVATRQIHVSHREAEMRAAKHKMTKYTPVLLNGTIQELIPFVVGPFGNIGQHASEFLKALDPPEPNRLRLQISMAACRATARMILAWLSLARRVR